MRERALSSHTRFDGDLTGGITHAHSACMGIKSGSGPSSYDEIVRRTVPEPDSSFRPTTDQVAQAGEESRSERQLAQMTDDERALHARIAQAIASVQRLGEISFELDGGSVTLSGRVHDAASIQQVESLVSAVGGIASINNRLVVSP